MQYDDASAELIFGSFGKLRRGGGIAHQHPELSPTRTISNQIGFDASWEAGFVRERAALT